MASFMSLKSKRKENLEVGSGEGAIRPDFAEARDEEKEMALASAGPYNNTNNNTVFY